MHLALQDHNVRRIMQRQDRKRAARTPAPSTQRLPKAEFDAILASILKG